MIRPAVIAFLVLWYCTVWWVCQGDKQVGPHWMNRVAVKEWGKATTYYCTDEGMGFYSSYNEHDPQCLN